MYLNYDDHTSNINLHRFEDITEDLEVDEIENDEIREIILSKQEKGVKPNPKIVRFKKFLLEEILGGSERK